MNKTKRTTNIQKSQLKIQVESVRILTATELKSVAGMSGDGCATGGKTGPTAVGGR